MSTVTAGELGHVASRSLINLFPKKLLSNEGFPKKRLALPFGVCDSIRNGASTVIVDPQRQAGPSVAAIAQPWAAGGSGKNGDVTQARKGWSRNVHGSGAGL